VYYPCASTAFPGNAAPVAGSSYTLNVSLSSAVVSSDCAGSTLAGGAGDDTYYLVNAGRFGRRGRERGH